MAEGRAEASEEVRWRVAELCSRVAETAAKNSAKLRSTLSEWDEVDEEASEEERREFVCLAQDVLEEEGAEDCLLLSVLAMEEKEERQELDLASYHSCCGLNWLGIVAALNPF